MESLGTRRVKPVTLVDRNPEFFRLGFMGVVWTVVAAVTSGLLFQAAIAPVSVAALGWVCFVPTLFVCRGRGFAVGFGTGLAAVLMAAHLARCGLWCQPSLLDTDPGWIYTGFALFGLPVGVVHGLVGEDRTPKLWTPFLVAVWAVILESLLLVILPSHLALTQQQNWIMLRVASATGVWGVSFLVWSANLWLCSLIATQQWRWASALVAGLGAMSLIDLYRTPPAHDGLKVAALQVPIDDVENLVSMTRAMKDKGVDIVVWPEAAGLSFTAVEGTEPLVTLSRSLGSTLFTTTYDDQLRPLPHNAMAVWGRGTESAKYHKRKLFGGERATHRAGEVPVAVWSDDTVFGLNICFDTCFPHIIRETALVGDVGVVLLPTLDPGSPFGVCQAVHAAYTTFRAAESGVAIVRAEALAYSHIVDNQGQIVAQAGSGERAALSATVSPVRNWTLYRQFGDWFLGLCFLVVVTAKILTSRASKGQRQG